MASVRLAGDPDKYIRMVKGGRFQARPYADGVRYNLGQFPTRGEAREAIHRFWWGKLRELPKHTYRVVTDGVERFMVRVRHEADGFTYVRGPFESREVAGEVAAALVLGLYGPLFFEAALQRVDHSLPPARRVKRSREPRETRREAVAC